MHKLLIVDDEKHVFHGLRRTLHREPWELAYASSAEEALAFLGQHPIDVLVADENMPGMSGTQLLGRVRQRWPDVIRMMLTGEARVDVVANAVNRGEVYRFFTKPCSEAELIVAMRDALKLRELKQESRRLLDTVRRQALRIRALESAGRSRPDGHADALACGPDDEVVEVTATLEEITGRCTTGVKPGTPTALESFGRDDVDALLDEIRTELDDIAG